MCNSVINSAKLACRDAQLTLMSLNIQTSRTHLQTHSHIDPASSSLIGLGYEVTVTHTDCEGGGMIAG